MFSVEFMKNNIVGVMIGLKICPLDCLINLQEVMSYGMWGP